MRLERNKSRRSNMVFVSVITGWSPSPSELCTVDAEKVSHREVQVMVATFDYTVANVISFVLGEAIFGIVNA